MKTKKFKYQLKIALNIALNTSKETIRTILHEDLGITKVCRFGYAKFIPHTLTDAQKAARIVYAEEVVAAARNQPYFLNSIVAADEVWCFQYDPKIKPQNNNYNLLR